MAKKISRTQCLGLCFTLLFTFAVNFSANAAPLLYLNEIVDLGNGMTGYDFWINANDIGQDSPYGNYNGARSMAIELTFSSASGVGQSKAYGAITVNSASDSLLWSASSASGYSQSNDSFYYDDIWSPLLHQPSSTSTSFYLHLATQPGGIFNSGHLAYIVTGSGLNVSGTIARFGTDYNVSHEFMSEMYSAPMNAGGLVAAPEPSSALLIGMGLIGLTVRSKRSTGKK